VFDDNVVVMLVILAAQGMITRRDAVVGWGVSNTAQRRQETTAHTLNEIGVWLPRIESIERAQIRSF
jgi:hypothetical protein